jgi:hypothetical protein
MTIYSTHCSLITSCNRTEHPDRYILSTPDQQQTVVRIPKSCHPHTYRPAPIDARFFLWKSRLDSGGANSPQVRPMFLPTGIDETEIAWDAGKLRRRAYSSADDFGSELSFPIAAGGAAGTRASGRHHRGGAAARSEKGGSSLTPSLPRVVASARLAAVVVAALAGANRPTRTARIGRTIRTCAATTLRTASTRSSTGAPARTTQRSIAS